MVHSKSIQSVIGHCNLFKTFLLVALSQGTACKVHSPLIFERERCAVLLCVAVGPDVATAAAVV